MKEMGIEFLPGEIEDTALEWKHKKQRERAARRKYEEEILRLSEPKKKFKMNPQNIFEIEMVDRSKLKPRVLLSD